MRKHQAQQLVKAINHSRRSELKCAVLVAGDFNLRPSDYAQHPTIIDDIARQTTLRDAYESLNKSKNINADRFLYGSSLGVEITPRAVRKLWDPETTTSDKRLSDHEAVEFEFEWRPIE